MPRGNSRESSATSSWKIVIVAVVAVVAVALTYLAFAAASAPATPTSATQRPIPTFGTQPTIPDRVLPAEAMPRLDDTTRPFTVVVFGDSTGAIGSSWVYQTAAWMSATYNRPVLFNQWAVELQPNGYQPVQKIGSGTGAPITFWNASASGKNTAYSIDNYDAMTPIDRATVDLAFINHGHNHAPNTLVSLGEKLLDKMYTDMPDAAKVIIAQNPEADNGPNVAGQRSNTLSWMDWAARNGYAVANVRKAFIDYGDYASIIDAIGVHPTIEGSRIWADQVIATLTS